jgi:hypothetical protein
MKFRIEVLPIIPRRPGRSRSLWISGLSAALACVSALEIGCGRHGLVKRRLLRRHKSGSFIAFEILGPESADGVTGITSFPALQRVAVIRGHARLAKFPSPSQHSRANQQS